MTCAHCLREAMEQFAKTSFESLAFCPFSITPDVRLGTDTMREEGSLDPSQHQEGTISEPQDRYRRGGQNVPSVPTFADCKPLPISQSEKAQP